MNSWISISRDMGRWASTIGVCGGLAVFTGLTPATLVASHELLGNRLQDSVAAESAKKLDDSQDEAPKKTLTPVEQKKRCETMAAKNQEAKSAKEYSELIAEIELELATYQYLTTYQDYLHTLSAWALTKRGELRMEVAFEFDRVENQGPATQAYDQALTDFDRALQLQPTQWKAHLNRGIVLGKKEQWIDAATAFKHSIQARPGQTLAYFNLAEIESQLGNWEEALQNYDRILTTSPNDAQALNGRGLALLGSGRGEDAVSVFLDLTEQRPTEPWLWANLGDAHQSTGQWEAAEKAYLAGLEREQHPAIYRRLAWLYATCPESDLNRPEAAMAVAKRAIANLKVVTSEYWDTLAAAQASAGQFDEAVDSMDQALKQLPEQPALLDRRALYEQKQAYRQSVRLASEPSLLDR